MYQSGATNTGYHVNVSEWSDKYWLSS